MFWLVSYHIFILCMSNNISVKSSSPALLCALVHSFITVVDQVFINEGTSVSLKPKDALEREERRGSKEAHARSKKDEEGGPESRGGG